MPPRIKLKVSLPADAVSSHSLSPSVASAVSGAAAAVKNTIVKGAKTLAWPLKKARQALSRAPSRSKSAEHIDLTRLGSEPDTEPSAGPDVASDEDCDPITELDNVSVQYHNSCPCHFFPCAACKCKTALGGVRHYQDTKDKSLTTNLKHHTIGCFGEDAVTNTLKGKDATPNSGSIFAAFARQGQQPVCYSHRMHLNPEVV
ncbi:hypothetical protein JVT61DRAFT_4615 [Boletus reticuloceps]|uniref:Uncharacterized protein n=1 Tax=Boletus reticuloceps TaxID=495285 RepID=A0A8I3A8I2_9AGAM|nr:hypothetical protein JVT61DRAFT_4615 [Boletus reticuloceps]